MESFRRMPVEDFIGKLSAPTPTPGGGTAAAVVGAMAAALLNMAASISLKRSQEERTLQEARECSERLRESLLYLADRDSAAYERVVEAYRLPKGTEEEKRARKLKIQEALREAAEVPLRTAELALEILETARRMKGEIRSSVLSDLLVAVRLAYAGVHAALCNVDVNLSSMEDEEVKKELWEKRCTFEQRAEELLRELLTSGGSE
jgi:glutamate formiminotransferase/formiminotetrahydrofolate cyclodeaminase